MVPLNPPPPPPTLFFMIFIIITANVLFAGACTNPKVSASSYTPADSQVLAAIPFIAEFTLECGQVFFIFSLGEGGGVYLSVNYTDTW